jgi:hypothetical protein
MEAKPLSQFILILLLGFLCVTGYTQKKETVEELSKRIERLEEQKDNLNQLGTRLENRVNEKLNQLEEKFQLLKEKKFDSLKEEILIEQKRNNSIFDTLLIILALLGIGGVGSLWGLKKFVDYKSKEFAEKMIKEIFEKERKKISELIKKQGEEILLREEKKILVLTPTDADDSFVRDFFQEMKFVEVEFGTPDTLSNLKKYHLILFNNEDEKFKEGIIPGLVKKTKGILFFYFGPPTKDSREIQNEKNVAFANYGAQLYGNLINALRYQVFL